MPPLPVITNVYRCALNWTTSIGGGGRTAVNVLHFRSTGDATHVGTTIADALETLFASNNPFGLVDGDYDLTNIDVLKLDGTSTTVSVPVSGVGGGGSGDSIPNMACVLSVKTAQRGPRGRGRTYIGPITEGGNDGGFLTSSAVAAAVAANWVMFHEACRDADPTVEPVVASYTHHDAHDITSVRCDFRLGSQRRRLSRL